MTQSGQIHSWSRDLNEMFEFWDRQLKPRGYKLKVQIIDFPGGMPGDVGITLK